MTGIELLAAAAVGYLIRKARRVAGRADETIDEVLDAGMDRVSELVEEHLAGDPALTLLAEQAGEGTETDRTRQRAELAIAEKLETDSGFADQLGSLLRDLERKPGGIAVSANAGIAAAGDVKLRGGDHSAVAGVTAVAMNFPTRPDPDQA